MQPFPYPHPYSSSFPRRFQQGTAARLISKPGAEVPCVQKPAARGCSLESTVAQDTHRPATNPPPDRGDDFGRLSRRTVRLGRLTNLSDAGDHASTIRLSQGSSQRVCVLLFLAFY